MNYFIVLQNLLRLYFVNFVHFDEGVDEGEARGKKTSSIKGFARLKYASHACGRRKKQFCKYIFYFLRINFLENFLKFEVCGSRKLFRTDVSIFCGVIFSLKHILLCLNSSTKLFCISGVKSVRFYNLVIHSNA